ncbi:MAG: hypothetical protein ACUVV1_05055 [Fimbriimonadales bacterium]
MTHLTRFFGLVAVTALVSISSAQSLADRLRDAGSISFKISNADYAVNIDAGQGCVVPFASGTTGAQDAFVINFEPNSLNFTATLNQVVNSIQSNAPIRFVASVSGDRVTWTAENITSPICTFISIEGTDYPFRIDSVFGTITVDLAAIACTDDPLGLLNREVSIQLNNVQAISEVGFSGYVTDSVCTPLIPACARAYNFQMESYGGARLEGDVDCNGCVDDADLLAVLFAFGGAGGAEDLNGDGVVDDADLLLVLFAFGNGC